MNKPLSFLITILLSFISGQHHFYAKPAPGCLQAPNGTPTICEIPGGKDFREDFPASDPVVRPWKNADRTQFLNHILCSGETLAAIDEEVVDGEILLAE